MVQPKMASTDIWLILAGRHLIIFCCSVRQFQQSLSLPDNTVLTPLFRLIWPSPIRLHTIILFRRPQDFSLFSLFFNLQQISSTVFNAAHSPYPERYIDFLNHACVRILSTAIQSLSSVHLLFYNSILCKAAIRWPQPCVLTLPTHIPSCSLSVLHSGYKGVLKTLQKDVRSPTITPSSVHQINMCKFPDYLSKTC